MSFKKKLILGLLIAVFALLGALSAVFLYLYHNPDLVKSLLESEISRYAKNSFTIGDLSYSLHPLKIRAREILLKPLDKGSGIYLRIPDLIADMALEGPFGNRSLIFKRLKVDGFSLDLNKGMNLPEISPTGGHPSIFWRFLTGLTALLFFRDIQLEGVELLDGRIEARMGDQRVRVSGFHANLDPDHRVSISCGGEWNWPSQGMVFIAPHIHIITDHALSLRDPKIKSLVTIKRATFHSPGKTVEDVALKATLLYDYHHKKLEFEPIDLQLEGLTLKHPSGIDLSPLNLYLKANGLLDLGEGHVEVSDFKLRGEDIFQLTGSLSMGFGPQPGLRLRSLHGHLLPKEIPPLLPEKMRAAFTPFSLEGEIRFQGEIQAIREQGKWEWAFDLKPRFNKNPFGVILGEDRLTGLLMGEISLQGRWPAVDLSGRIRGEQTILSAKGMEMDPSEIELSFSSRWPLLKVNDLKIQIPRLRIKGKEEGAVIDDILLQAGDGHMNWAKRSLTFQGIQIRSSLAKNLQMAVEAGDKRIVIQLQGEDIAVPPAGWQWRGHDFLKLKAESRAGDVWDVQGMMGVKDLAFQNQGGTIMGAKIHLLANTSGSIDLRRSKTVFKASLEVKKGEFLYDRLYLNLSETPFLVSGEGQYEAEKERLSLSSCKMVLENIITLHAHGQLLHKKSAPLLDLSVELPDMPLKALFHHFILEPFRTETPFLSQITMSGDLSGAFRARYDSKDRSLKGNCVLREGNLSMTDGAFSLKGIHLNLPIWYRDTASEKGPDLSTEEDSLEGRLTIDVISIPLLPQQPLNIPLEAKPNQLLIRSGIPVRVPSGHLSLGPLMARDIFDPGRSIDTSLIVDAFELAPVLSQIGSPVLQGTLSGKLDPIHFENQKVTTQGELLVAIFGGRLIISDIAASGVFTPAPVFRLNARWDDMNLGEITTETSFGKIEGILRGYIHDLEMAHGQPQRFDLLLESVKSPEIPQRISIKAVENIAQIGGGQSPFMGLAGAFASFFKDFPYEKIGIHAFLENDIFRINGTVKEGGVEYLVKRGSFSGVNVVNQNPDNRIRFKDMVNRIKRITAFKGKPVVE